MSEIIPFKPRTPPACLPEELPHYHPVICELAALAPRDRLSVIAAACDDDDWKEIFELAVYSIGAKQYDLALSKNQNARAEWRAVTRELLRIAEKVIAQASGAAP